MRIFLAGATGVIGRRLVPLLVDRGHSVTGFVRRSADADWLYSLGAKAVRGDVFDADGVRRAVALAAGVRRVVAQSIAWAYEAGSVPATEDVPLDLGSEGSRLRT